MTKLLLTLILILTPVFAFGQTDTKVKADILSTSTVMLGTDSVKFMPAKLVSVDTSGAEVKTYITPKISLSKWNKEETLTLEILSDVGYTDKTVDSATGEVRMSNDKEGFYFKTIPEDNSILKYGIILNYTPKNTQKWSFKLGGNWQNMDFCYQTPLTDAVRFERDKEWYLKGTDGVLKGVERLEKVDGSYAVFHKWKANHITGQTNYGIGKLFPIYRPRLLDADNNFLGWVDLTIKDGLYNLSIDNISQDVLDKAPLPLKFNDEVGYHPTTGGGSFYNGFYYGVGAYNVQAGSNGTMSKIWVYTSSVQAHVSLAVYDSAVTGGGRVTSSYHITTPTINSWNSVDCSGAAVSVVSGTSYYPTISATDSGHGITYDSSGTHAFSTSIDIQDPMPLTHPNITAGTLKLAMYIEYTAGGGEATPRRRIILISRNYDIHKNSTSGRLALGDCYTVRRKKVFAA